MSSLTRNTQITLKNARNTKILSDRKKCFIQKLYDIESGTRYFCLFTLRWYLNVLWWSYRNLNNTSNHSRKYVFQLCKYMYWGGWTSFRIPVKVNFPSSISLSWLFYYSQLLPNVSEFFVLKITHLGHDNVSDWLGLTQL